MPGLLAAEVSIEPSDEVQEAIIRADRRFLRSIFEPNFSVPSMMFEYFRATLDKKESSISSCGYNVL